MTPEIIGAIILVGGLVLLIALRVPITFAVGIATVACLLYMELPLLLLGQQIVRGISSFSLMAVPFFITMGALLAVGGVGDKLVELADALVGWMRGGLAQVNVIDSVLFGGISGSAAADVASIGSVIIPLMKKNGYKEDFTGALTMSSAVQGLITPPSHNIVIYSTAAGGVSIGALFLAGYLPGAVLAVLMMTTVYILSVKRNYPKGSKFNVRNVAVQCVRSFWAMAVILIVVVGVIAGWFTATESAAIAVIYTLLVSIYIYKGMKWKEVWGVLGNAIEVLSIVMILIAISGAFGYCLTILRVPAMAAELVYHLTDNPIVILLLINLILLLLGSIMDMAPVILIATPILLPLAVAVGMSPITFGILIVLNCGIGLLTPPVGTVLFITSSVAKVPVEKLIKAAWPFYICLLAALMLITFVPALTLTLPRIFM